MKRYLSAIALLSALSACGSGVFTESGADDGDTDSGTVVDTTGVPAAIAGNLESVTYDPGDPGAGVPARLLVKGVGFDSAGEAVDYVRKPALDANVPGFQTFTFQADGDSRHYTAFVRESDGVVVAVTGSGQFGQFLAGATFDNTGTFSAPASDAVPDLGSVQYNGAYAGILNVAGDGGDLLTPSPGTTGSAVPAQLAEVSGTVRIVGDFQQNLVTGTIQNREIADSNTALEDLDLLITPVGENGGFEGDIEVTGTNSAIGTYAGTFGGDGATAVGGAINAANHTDAIPGGDEIEYGVFTATR
ncbi:MAG: thymidylate synthase [Paracoccaceae bacterium]